MRANLVRILILILLSLAILLATYLAPAQAEPCIPSPSNGYCRPPVVVDPPVSPIELPKLFLPMLLLR